MYKKAFIFIFCCIFLLACTPQKKEIIQDDKTVSNWESDLETLVDTLESVHPDPYRTYNKELFYQDLEALRKSLPTLTAIEFKLSIAELLAKLGDGHTRVEELFTNEDKIFGYPLGFKWFDKELIIIGTTPEYKKLLGAKLVSINNMPLEKIVNKVNSLIPHDAENILYAINPQYINITDILSYLKIVDKNETVEFKFKDHNNKSVTLNIHPINAKEVIEVEKLPLPKLISDVSNLTKNYEGLYGYHVLSGGEVLYIQYNQCDYSYFKQFSEDIISTILREKPTRIIFDLRKNTGGDSQLMTSLVKKLIDQTDIKNIKNDLLIGKATASSSIVNSIEIKKQLGAKSYGEDTGQSINSFGEVLTKTLPFTKLKINYSTKEFILDKNNDGPMKPDVYCTQTYSDYENGIDTCMELVLYQSSQ